MNTTFSIPSELQELIDQLQEYDDQYEEVFSILIGRLESPDLNRKQIVTLVGQLCFALVASFGSYTQEELIQEAKKLLHQIIPVETYTVVQQSIGHPRIARLVEVEAISVPDARKKAFDSSFPTVIVLKGEVERAE